MNVMEQGFLSNNGHENTLDDRHYSLEPDLGTSSCSYESVVSPSTDHLCAVSPDKLSLQSRQRVALEFVEQSSGCHENILSEGSPALAAIHADLKLEMSALSNWVTDVGVQSSTEDFDDHHGSSFSPGFSGNGCVGRTRTRENNGRLSFVADEDREQQLHMSSFHRFPRNVMSSAQVTMQPPKGMANTMMNFISPRHQQQQQQHQYHQHQLESIQQLQQFQIPGQFCGFDDTTVTMGLPSFGSSPGDRSEDSLIMDQWDGGMSPPNEKRRRLMSPSPAHHTSSVIHHPPMGLSSMRDSLPPSNLRRMDDGGVESTLASVTHPAGGSRLAAAEIGVNIQGINEMLSHFNPAQPPRPRTPPVTHLQQPQQLGSVSSLVNSKSMSAPLDLGAGPSQTISSSLLENQVRIPPPNGISGDIMLSTLSVRGLQDGLSSSPALSLKGLSSLGAAHDANAMEQLLVHCAEALEKKDVNSAQQIMWALSNIVSANGDPHQGDPNQRVASCFLKALVRRASRMMPGFDAMYGEDRVSKPVNGVEYAVIMDITPWYRFGFKAANGAMLQAFEGNERVHIVDFTTTYGMQWPTLIEALSGRPEGPPHVRLTIHKARPDVAPYLGMSQEDVINRLVMFAATKNVELDVSVVPYEIELLDRSMFDLRDDEVTVANCMYRGRFIPDESAGLGSGSGQCCPRDDFLRLVHSLNPSLVTVIDEEANVTSPSLVARLKAAFNYLWIPFDSLDTFLPRDSPQRLEYELVLAKKIENIIVNEGLDRIERMETKDKWGQRMKKAGFEPVPFTEDVVEEVKIMLSDHAAGWGMKQDEDSMLLTWKGHNVLFATVWRPLSPPLSLPSIAR